jgi:hypothetical protein
VPDRRHPRCARPQDVLRRQTVIAVRLSTSGQTHVRAISASAHSCAYPTRAPVERTPQGHFAGKVLKGFFAVQVVSDSDKHQTSR